jgi:putative endonuclease
MAPPNERRRLGQQAEAEAARFLEAQGLELIARNWRATAPRRVEIDLVMRDATTVVFVEVRAQRRASGGFSGHPSHTIGPEKQRRLALAATTWLQHQRSMGPDAWQPRAVRFDVAALTVGQDGTWNVVWFRRAFEVA